MEQFGLLLTQMPRDACRAAPFLCGLLGAGVAAHRRPECLSRPCPSAEQMLWFMGRTFILPRGLESGKAFKTHDMQNQALPFQGAAPCISCHLHGLAVNRPWGPQEEETGEAGRTFHRLILSCHRGSCVLLSCAEPVLWYHWCSQ